MVVTSRLWEKVKFWLCRIWRNMLINSLWYEKKMWVKMDPIFLVWAVKRIGLAFTERRTAARWTYVGENVGSLVLDILYMRCLLWNMRSLFIEVETWRYWVVRLSDKIQGTQVIRISDKCKILFLDKHKTNLSWYILILKKLLTVCLKF